MARGGFLKKNYKVGVLRRLAKGLSPLLTPLERQLMGKYSGGSDPKDDELQPVFIIGAPRSGSTALYQALTECLDLLYIDNLAALFYRNIYWGMWLSRTVFRRRNHGCFLSQQGSTVHCGLHAPAECGDFWYRWLPRQPHYIPKGYVADRSLQEMSRNIFGIIRRFRLPLLFKNLNAGQRLGMISQIAPNAKFIFIRRDPLYTAQSILDVKRKLGLDERSWWSIMPQNHDRLLSLDGPDMAVAQVYYLERRIMEDRRLFSPEQWMDVRYEDFCADVSAAVYNVRNFISPGILMKKDPGDLAITLRQEQTVDDELFQRLREACDIWNWESYDIQ